MQKAQAVQELRPEIPLKMLMSVARLSRSTFYYELKRMERGDKYASAKTEIQRIFAEHKGRYGYRRITAELQNRGFHRNHKVVSRLMKELGLVCRVRMKRYRSYRGEVGRIAQNLLERNFEAASPNEKMVTDITEFHLYGQKLYLSVMLDLYSRDKENERAILEKLIRSQHEIDSITALENFILGFRLGVRMMAECMDANDGDIRNGGV